jgi:hypothetical protein
MVSLISTLLAAAAISSALAAPQGTATTAATTPQGSGFHHFHHFGHHEHNCSAGQSRVEIPHASVHFPATAEQVFNVVGDFFNTSWMPGESVVSTTGTDNTANATRVVTGNPFAETDVLAFYKVNNTGDFRAIQAYKNGAPVSLSNSTDFTAQTSFTMLSIRPECNGTVAKLEMKSSFCTTGTAPEGMDLATLVSAQASGAMQQVWTQDLALSTAFNTTPACVAQEEAEFKARFHQL